MGKGDRALPDWNVAGDTPSAAPAPRPSDLDLALSISLPLSLLRVLCLWRSVTDAVASRGREASTLPPVPA